MKKSRGLIIINNEGLLNDTLSALALLYKTKALKNVLSILSGETFILAHLNDLGGKSTPSALAQNCDFTPSRLSAIIKALEAKNFINRIENENDKRSILVQITDTGKVFIENKVEKISSHTMFVIQSLGEEDSQHFVRIINKILEAEQQISEDELILAKNEEKETINI